MVAIAIVIAGRPNSQTSLIAEQKAIIEELEQKVDSLENVINEQKQ